MDKLKMHSKDKTQENFEVLQKLFPNAVTETIVDGEVVRAIDKDVLQQEINAAVVEGKDERYQFTWPDKKRAIISANAPINKTLRPCREESVDFDNTENLYIEGDNLEVLKLLQETYLGKIKMIYIDPPYNTGHDFVYNDKFSVSPDEWDEMSGELDEYGNRLVQNTESNGRFHTDWLNMIYPRLKIARDLLTDDGGIIVSIDDNEIDDLKQICNEVFGKANFVATVVWQKIHSTKNDARFFSENHEYALLFAKDINNLSIGLLPRTEQMNERYKNPDNDTRGPWQSGDLVASGERSNGHYIVESPITGKKFDVPQGKHWVYSEENLLKLINDNQIWFGNDGNSFPRKKRFLSEVQDGRTPNTIWLAEEVGHNQTATRELKALFENNKYFDFPKPVDYIAQFIKLLTNSDSIIMDFFSGSATTAHAVMRQNIQDISDGKKGKRKFIMVQLPEKTDEKSEAYKAGYKNICEIGKERIRRAGSQIKEETRIVAPLEKAERETGLAVAYYDDEAKEYGDDVASRLDIGFRVLKLDSSNMKDVYYNPADFQKSLLDTTIDNIKEDRTPEDLLFQVMLDLGVLLSSKIEESEIVGKKVFNVADGFLIACFDNNVNEEVITAVAKQQPIYFVMRDSSLSTDTTATNFDQIFETYSPETVRKVI